MGCSRSGTPTLTHPTPRAGGVKARPHTAYVVDIKVHVNAVVGEKTREGVQKKKKKGK